MPIRYLRSENLHICKREFADSPEFDWQELAQGPCLGSSAESLTHQLSDSEQHDSS